MKRKLLYGLVFLTLALVRVERCEIGRLIPVEVVAVDTADNLVRIETDTGNVGVGKSFQEAYGNLRETASGNIYLDTACWLILSEGDAINVEAVKEYLKGNVGVCLGASKIDLTQVGAYLSAHRPAVRLKQMEKGVVPQYISAVNNGFKLW